MGALSSCGPAPSKGQLSLPHSLESQNPSFDLGHLELGWCQAGAEEFREAAVEIGGAHPRPWGARGIGEHSMVPTLPAIANAIHDAVGIRLEGPPYSAERVFLAMLDAGIVK